MGSSDIDGVQRDINRSVEWAEGNGMEVNAAKIKRVSFTQASLKELLRCSAFRSLSVLHKVLWDKAVHRSADC